MCKKPIWDLARSRSYPFQNLNSELSQYSADVALFLVTTEDYNCNIYTEWERIGGVAGWIFTAAHPFAIVMDTYAQGDRTAQHEIGHVLGGNHEIEEPKFLIGDGTPFYARGLVSSTDSWQSIMGGYVGCPFVYLPSQPTCVRINQWSNPLLYYQGENTGVANESNMALALETTAPIVATWTSFPIPAPTTAPTLTVVPEYCFGSNTLAWTTISGATHYQLFSSSTSSFTGSDRIYIGPDTGLFVNVSYNSTEYFRVRACNGNGCGPYSSIKSASYYNGCL